MRQDDHEYHGRVARWIRAYGRRVATIDPAAVAQMANGLREELAKAELAAVQDLHSQGYSWQEIADAYGITRGAAIKRWNR